MTLKQLTYFLKIAETCNLTKAAQQLNISQPPLSYQLKLLEDELGVQLFIRDSRNLHITKEGIYLQNKASQILSLVDRTVEEVKTFSVVSPTTISIGSVSSINHNLLPDVIKEFKETYPKSIFNIYDGSSFRIMELLDNNVIDLGILREPFNHNLYPHKKIKITFSSTAEDDYFVAAGKKELFPLPYQDSPEIPLTALAPCPLVIHRRFEENFQHDCNTKHVLPNIISRNDNIVTSIEWAKNSLGIAHMPLSSSLLIDDPSITAKKIIDPVSSANLYVIWKQENKLPLALLEFINLLT